jgi:pyruvate kinase
MIRSSIRLPSVAEIASPLVPLQRRTKIVATIGPASDSPAMLRALCEAGMDMARLGLAHGPVEESIERLRRVRAAAGDVRRVVGLLADLPGPKVRAAAFVENGIYLTEDAVVDLYAADDGAMSDWRRIGVDTDPEMLAGLEPGDRVALGDGGVLLEVDDVVAGTVTTRVLAGGRLQGRPGVNLPPEKMDIATPTPEDLRLLEAVVEAGVDAVAVSFVRTAADVQAVKDACGPDGPMVIAKIETAQAVEHVERIIAVSDGVMVARGDLGVRCAAEDVPHHQKHIIRTGVAYARPVITATQMLESMVHAPTPTRAEVSDVANAVFDGTSALMLSGETAIGAHPAESVAFMSKIAQRAEREFDYAGWGARLGRQQLADAHQADPEVRITAAISAAAWRAAADVEATAIIACTASGSTARAISRFRPTAPIFACTPSERTARRLSVAWGIRPIVVEERRSTDEIVWFAVEAVAKTGIIKRDDIVAVLAGSPVDPDPATDVLRLVRVH